MLHYLVAAKLIPRTHALLLAHIIGIRCGDELFLRSLQPIPFGKGKGREAVSRVLQGSYKP